MDYLAFGVDRVGWEEEQGGPASQGPTGNCHGGLKHLGPWARGGGKGGGV